ncbi:hypothetical protein [Entomomonas asaccharolytica]|uniref:SPOR domain-containing protein n=1 Tax=Entomomonas asaccharolytica TaxID=2785331 RepID=A0A974NEW2_9GAMM|nr:hypothetical protein [Entomomonas asaccharolytica]QQP85408.1 hypothetical protein JHT90_13670 [Entomomonas asaccharolytica]
MRWVFVFFVFLNIFFYIWQYQQATPTSLDNPVTTTYGNTEIPTIKLFKEQPMVDQTATIDESENHQEIPPADLSTEKELADIDNAEIKEVVSEPLTCLYLGGFTNPVQLDVINPFLEKLTTNINPIVIKLTKAPKFHLYVLANNEIEQQALLEILDNASINALIIPRGLLKDNISLGVFTEETAYSDIQDKLKALDITVKIENLSESASSYWLKITNDKRSLFTYTILAELTQQLPSMQQELMPCDFAEN